MQTAGQQDRKLSCKHSGGFCVTIFARSNSVYYSMWPVLIMCIKMAQNDSVKSCSAMFLHYNDKGFLAFLFKYHSKFKQMMVLQAFINCFKTTSV